jgi:hypothetical protein
MEIANEVEVTALACQAKWPIVACVQRGAILMKISDDLEVATLICPTERLVVECPQVSTALMKPTNRIEVAASGGFGDRLIHGSVFSASSRRRSRHAAQLNHLD